MRVFSRTRWWWTAPVSSSDGIGASGRRRTPRSDSTMMRAPSAMACGHLGADLARARARSAAPPPATRYRPRTTCGGEARQVAVVVDVDDLGELVVVEDRERQHDLAAGGRASGSSRLPSGPIVRRGEVTSSSRIASSGGLVTWANSWREVVEEQPRPVGQHRDGGVGAHRPDRLGAGAGHRGQQDPQLLLGVAEGLLAAHDRRRRRGTTCSRLGQVVEARPGRRAATPRTGARRPARP